MTARGKGAATSGTRRLRLGSGRDGATRVQTKVARALYAEFDFPHGVPPAPENVADGHPGSFQRPSSAPPRSGFAGARVPPFPAQVPRRSSGPLPRPRPFPLASSVTGDRESVTSWVFSASRDRPVSPPCGLLRRLIRTLSRTIHVRVWRRGQPCGPGAVVGDLPLRPWERRGCGACWRTRGNPSGRQVRCGVATAHPTFS